MTTIRIDAIYPKDFMRDPNRFVVAVENSLNEVANKIKVDFQITTQTWKNRPVFFIRRSANERFIGTTGLIYKFVSGGTKPHLITAHTPKGLAFYATGFAPKTKVRTIASYAGKQADSNRVHTMVVHHPGNESREYPEVIAEKYSKTIGITLQRAIDSQI